MGKKYSNNLMLVIYVCIDIRLEFSNVSLSYFGWTSLFMRLHFTCVYMCVLCEVVYRFPKHNIIAKKLYK